MATVLVCYFHFLLFMICIAQKCSVCSELVLSEMLHAATRFSLPYSGLLCSRTTMDMAERGTFTADVFTDLSQCTQLLTGDWSDHCVMLKSRNRVGAIAKLAFLRPYQYPPQFKHWYLLRTFVPSLKKESGHRSGHFTIQAVITSQKQQINLFQNEKEASR